MIRHIIRMAILAVIAVAVFIYAPETHAFDTRVGHAQYVLGRHPSYINLLTYTIGCGCDDGATPYDNIRDTANGGRAKRSNYGTAPGGYTDLQHNMLQGMQNLRQSYGYTTYRVTAIAGGSHSSTSLHYTGAAIDVDTVNGTRVSYSNPHTGFQSHCREQGAIEVLGPGDPGHDTHIHCAWPNT